MGLACEERAFLQLNRGRVRDPVCGMYLDPERAITRAVQGRVFYFCREGCAEEFLGRTGVGEQGGLGSSSSRTSSGPVIPSAVESSQAKVVGGKRSMR